MFENNKDYCDCPKKKCVRHGQCIECIEHHRKREQDPYCKRMKKSIFARLIGK